MNASEHFGKRLRELRQSRNLSAPELSKILYCSPSLIYNIEKGHNRAQPEFIVRTAIFFGVTTDYMLRDIDPNDEKELLDLYRNLNREEKLMMSYILRLLNSIRKGPS